MKRSKFPPSKKQYLIKKHFPLFCICKTEVWLQSMSLSGYHLVEVNSHRYEFNCMAPKKLHYFLFSTQHQQNDGSWVFYEFCQKGGNQIKHKGITIWGSDCFLYVTNEDWQNNKELYEYYYTYRNYSLLHRFVRNLFISSLFLFALVFLVVIDPSAASLYLGGICVVLLFFIWYALSIWLFVRSCKKAEATVAWKRPKRPGY